VIYYTVKGPSFHLEFHEDKLQLIKRSWPDFLRKQKIINTWSLDELSSFKISMPKYILWGKLEWETFEGEKGTFRFSTNALMVQKIEKYMQKKVIKNHQRKLTSVPKKTQRKFPKELSLAA
jgi:hypothetical protein